jgi:TonB family protein
MSNKCICGSADTARMLGFDGTRGGAELFALRISAVVVFMVVALAGFLRWIESKSPIVATFAARAPCGSARAIGAAPNAADDWDVDPARPTAPYFYPPIASRHRVQGTPVIAVCILIDGSVTDAALKKSSGSSQLDSAALVESGQWHFVPAPGGINGTPEWKDIAVTYSMPGTAPSSPPDSDADLPKSAKHETAQLGTEGMTRPTTDPGFPHGSRYSVLALRHSDQGKVVVSMAIGSDGWISEAKIDQSSGSDQLDAATLVSVGYWHYFPATRNGTALAIPWKARVVFKLSDMPPGAARSVH